MRELDKAFGYAEKMGAQVEPLLDIYQRNNSLDIETFRHKEIDEIKAAIHRFEDEHEKLHALENRTEIGICCLDRDNLKLHIQDSAQKCHKAVENLLPKINFEKAEELIKWVH